MALNLLGSHSQGGEQQSQEKVKMYIPQEQKTVNPPKEKKKLPVETVQPIEAEKQVDLAESILHRQALIRRLAIIGIAILILLVVGAVGVVIYLQQSAPKIVSNQPPVPTPTPTPSPVVNEVQPVPQPAPIVNEVPPAPVINEPAGPMPDTPLAPLRGSLIKFSTSNDLYLIENNGELRLVDQPSVVFQNGQSLSEITNNLIYLLPNKWQTVRKGDKIVEGQVDFDPRILSLGELLPFIQ